MFGIDSDEIYVSATVTTYSQFLVSLLIEKIIQVMQTLFYFHLK